jgi:hypothetical protein
MEGMISSTPVYTSLGAPRSAQDNQKCKKPLENQGFLCSASSVTPSALAFGYFLPGVWTMATPSFKM